VLAAAYAQAGRFDDASSVATTAFKLAADAGQKEFSDQIHQRLELYLSGKAYRTPPPREADRPVPQ
jgi:hypothetical protein